MANEITKSDKKLSSNASKLEKRYNELLVESAKLYPRVDQRLLLDILRFETTYKDWEGSVMLKIVYPAEGVDVEKKKDWLYSRYERVPSIEEKRTLRLKLIRMYLDDIESLLNDDLDIEYITGSATLTPTDAYSA
ncbi:MAG TPA: hypothetical protein VJS91_07915 [Nitrososphaeraceae archaeon]|nr:hypothetical protein [Nitrososphaeraceae archaeon]